MIPNTELISNYDGDLYFLSQNKIDRLYPRVPNNNFTHYGFEDSVTRRVCVAPSIGQCLRAISLRNEGKIFHVYKPDHIPEVIYKPNGKAVVDAEDTGELWILEPIGLVEIGTIRCTNDQEFEWIKE
jgi:hypothetical protein